MIIHQPKKTIADGRVRISARFEVESEPQMSDTLWFELPERFAGVLSSQSNAFAAILLVPTMHLGERLTVRGELSPQLLAGLAKYQNYFHGWFPHLLHRIDMTVEKTAVESMGVTERAAASTFSGGVDSFYTTLSLLPGGSRADSEYRYLVLIHGFDIYLEDRSTFEAAFNKYNELADELGCELIPVVTNFRDLRLANSVSWELTHGAVLGGVALILSPLLARFYIPSSHTDKDDLAWGSHPDTDPLLSTEITKIIHDAPGVTRTEKTRVVAESPHSHGTLRVCWENLDGVNNCCRCSKCTRTMLTLDLMGVLPRFKTFPLPLPKNLRRWAMTNSSALLFGQEVLQAAKDMGGASWLPDVEYAVRRSARTLAVADFISRLLRLDGGWSSEFVRNMLFRLQGLERWPDFGLRRWWGKRSKGVGEKGQKREKVQKVMTQSKKPR